MRLPALKTRQSDNKLETPLGLIGIRGTEFTIGVCTGHKVGVIGGQFNMRKDGGCVVVFKGQTSLTRSMFARPQIRAIVAEMLPAQAAGGSAVLSESAGATTIGSTGPYTSGEQIRSMLQGMPPAIFSVDLRVAFTTRWIACSATTNEVEALWSNVPTEENNSADR